MLKKLALSSLVVLGGCTNLPVDGPAHRDIKREATASLVSDRRDVVYDYVLVDVSDRVIACLEELGPGSFFKTFGTGRGPAPTIKVGVGDVVQVSIFESAAGGLFIPAEAGVRPGNFVTLPSQTVGRDGNIAIPYAGEIVAAGRTTAEIKRDIETKLANRAVEPQVVVTLVDQTASAVAILGDTLQGPSKLQIRPGERVLDMISRAGALRYPGYELFITLQRGGRRATVYLPSLVNEPRENIYVWPGDTLYVYREQQKYVAVGALGSGSQTSGIQAQFNFDQERLSLNEAIAKAGGLLDTRANASNVFLYRMEHRRALERLGLDLRKFPGDQAYIPTIYRANFRDPSSFFFAQRFPMRHKDAIYVANADSVELEKFLFHTRNITSTAAGVTTDVLTVRDATRGARILGGQ